ncbi:LegC family aminotransferase [Cellulophaga baltica]|uniref:LegC family aminotransferase n=1 Tax=Cellulophaga TaxID=104264 RepID=UPI001C07444B|nr:MULTISPECIES: LegC family aminotransferase [Cellulophaga]MBU2995981.1 LegC family aminotransferase [Cellulophaga baltica]MDO6767376.1 LegC family aminotransferase [Cellulophaga sp. 1_MG-2023]
MLQEFISFTKKTFNTEEFIPLHAPIFLGNEKEYLNECIDSTFVSSVGKFVDQFEADLAKFIGVKHAIATSNGTAALHIGLLMAGVQEGDEVITQPLTFIATCNAISYIKAQPVFVDVDKKTLGLSAEKLKHFLDKNAVVVNEECINKITKRKIKAVVPMHTFGFAADITEIIDICNQYSINVVEDAAESLGSYYKGKHTGTHGLVGAFSFNGNKTITTGGGGMLVTNDDSIALKAKHITTTAKIPHPWDYEHDMVGFNYRLPNINAALGCAQLEKLPYILERKKILSNKYDTFFKNKTIQYLKGPKDSNSNYWLNAIILENLKERNNFLKVTNENGVMTRPIWKLMTKLTMFKNSQIGNLDNAEWLEERVVNIPSSVII